MKGELTPEDQLRVLTRIWGADRDGFIFLPYISGSARTAQKRRSSYHEGRAFRWPRDRAAILDHLRGHENDDVYFTPAIFNGKRRVEQNVEAERSLWADLDPVDPDTLGDYKPTIAWETSPGRYQGIWLLDQPRTGASWAGKENHRLSLYLGADPSGWDGTQLLRVPGRANHKPAYGDQAVPGQLLWDNGPRYQWNHFDDLPEVGSLGDDNIDLLDEDLLQSVDRHELWAKTRLKVHRRVREYMAARETGGADRSEVLWQLEREFADAGCSVLEIIALVRPTVWNKYQGRQDEIKRLKIEAAKAVGAREEQPLEAEEYLDDEEKPGIQWLDDIIKKPIPRPSWIVDSIWVAGACGFISGQPKSYKSWMAIDLAVAVATGTAFLGMPEHTARRAQPVLYIQEEDDLGLVMQRLSSVVQAKAPGRYWHGTIVEPHRAPHDPEGPGLGVGTDQGLRESVRPLWRPSEDSLPLAVHVQAGFVASDPGWQSWLAEIVAEGRFAMVIIDTLGTTAGEVDTDRSGELMMKILRPLKIIAQNSKTAICLVHHNRKTSAEKTRAGSEMLGSVALHAWVDCALYARWVGGELTIEREAKQATELTIKVTIPEMFEHVPSGTRQLWQPTRVTEPSDELPDDQAKPQKKSRPTRVTAGLRAKLASLRFPRAAQDVEDILGQDELKRLMNSGILKFDPAHDKYEWIKK